MEKGKLQALISLLDDTDNEVFEHVQQTIISLGITVIDELEEEWGKNLNPYVQERIESLISQIQIHERTSSFLKWKESENQDLLEGLWLISTIQYPDYTHNELQESIELLFLKVWEKFDLSLKGRDAVSLLNKILFHDLKYGSNTKHFHSPENSVMKSVLATKKGNPISLAMVYLIIARKLKLPIFGVSLPKIFVLTYLDDNEQFYINVFNKGLVFTNKDIESYVEQLNLPRKDSYFSPCENIDIITRFLTNMIVAYDRNGQKDKKEEVRELLLYLKNDSSSD